ncbi:MAG TPA: PAS domain-containing protein [Gemmatimonadales bacterium]|nr:PAS domain-containing protein [Gemmatimonadales bacterium]
MPSDHQRTRQELIHELVALRKQVADLRQAAHERQRVEEALRASEARYRAWLEELPVATARLDADGRLAGANEALAQLLGYAHRGELVELAPVLGLWAARDQELRLAPFLRERRAFHGELSLRARDGDIVPVTAHLRPTRDGGGWTVTLTPRFAGEKASTK